MTSWKHSWIHFLQVVTDPFALLVLGIAGVAFWQSATVPDRHIATLLTLFAAVAAGIVSNLWTRSWTALMEQGPLQVRGMAAVRDLSTMVSQIRRLASRISVHQERHAQGNQPLQVTTNCFEEVVIACAALEEAAINSIEHWRDLLPQAQMTPVVERLRITQVEADQTRAERDALRERLMELEQMAGRAGQSDEALERQRHQLAELETQLERLQKQLREGRRRAPAWTPRYSAGTGFVYAPMPETDFSQVGMDTTCENCGQAYRIADPNDVGLCYRCLQKAGAGQLDQPTFSSREPRSKS